MLAFGFQVMLNRVDGDSTTVQFQYRQDCFDQNGAALGVRIV